MALNYVTLTLDLYDGQGNPVTSGVAYFTPTVQLTDTTNHADTIQAPVPGVFHSGGLPAVKLLATDNAAPLPGGWGWQVSFTGVPGSPAGFTFFLPYTGGASQFLSSQSPVSSAVTMQAYLPLPSGTPQAGQVPVATGSGEGSAWGDGGGAVSSVFTRTGAVTPQSGDYTVSEVTGAAPLASPALTGTPTAPTATPLTDSTQVSTTAYADSAVAVEASRAEAAEALKAPLASPVLTGSPTAPTQTTGDNSTKLATDAFVTTAVAAETSRAETAEALLAPLASPVLTGAPAAPTAAALTGSTQIATTAYADSAVAAETGRAETAEALALPAAGGTISGSLAVGGTLTAAGFGLPLTGISRRVPYRASTWRQLFQTGHGWTTSGAGVGSSNLNDTSTFIRGTQCATVTTANGIQAALSLLGGTAQDLTGKMIRLTFKVNDITHLSNIGFYVGTSSLGSNFLWNVFTSTPGFLNYVQSGEWVTVCVSWADLFGAATYTISGSGAPSTKTGFTDMRLAVYDDAAGTVTIHYQSVEIVPDTSATFPNGLVTVMFDDSYQSVYDLARPLMDTYGWGGSLCTIADQVGQAGRLTLAELQALQEFSGWEVAGHTWTLAAHDAGYETLTAAQVSTEMRNLKAWLVSNGFPANTFAYPMGFFSPTTDGVPVDQIAGEYFPAARTIISELNEVWPPPMPLRMFAVTGVSSFAGGVPVSTLTAANGPLVRCAQQGAWLQLSLHQIVTATPTSATQLLQSDLSTLLAFISSLGMTVLPAGAVTGYYS